MKALDNVTVKDSCYKTYSGETIEIDLDKIFGFFKGKDQNLFENDKDFTPENIIKFCRSFKSSDKKSEVKKKTREEYYNAAPGNKLELQKVFELDAQKNNEYSVLAHILLAQGGIKSKIVYASDVKGQDTRSFVIFHQDGKTVVLDPSVQNNIIELENCGAYMHQSGKHGKMFYTANIRHSRPVLPVKSSGDDVEDYSPANK